MYVRAYAGALPETVRDAGLTSRIGGASPAFRKRLSVAELRLSVLVPASERVRVELEGEQVADGFQYDGVACAVEQDT